MKTSQGLIEAKRLIDSPEKWFSLPAHLPEGKSHCVITAIVDVQLRAEGPYDNAVARLFAETVGTDIMGIPDWNNAPGRTHGAVLEAFDEAIRRALAQEAAEEEQSTKEEKCPTESKTQLATSGAELIPA